MRANGIKSSQLVSYTARCALFLTLVSCAAISNSQAPSTETWQEELATFVAEYSNETQSPSISLDPKRIEASLTAISTCPLSWVDDDAEQHSGDLVSSYYQWILSRGYWVAIYRLPNAPNMACGVLYAPERRILSPSDLALIETAGSLALKVTRDRLARERSAELQRLLDPKDQDPDPAKSLSPPDLGRPIDEKPRNETITDYIEKSHFPEGSGEKPLPPLIEAEEVLNRASCPVGPPSETERTSYNEWIARVYVSQRCDGLASGTRSFSAVLVSPQLIVSAAHELHRLGPNDRLCVVPGMTDQRPNGAFAVPSGGTVYRNPSYTGGLGNSIPLGAIRQDVAAVAISIGHPDRFLGYPRINTSQSVPQGATVNASGYSGTSQSRQSTSTGLRTCQFAAEVGPDAIVVAASASPGMSGGPIWAAVQGQSAVVGVNSQAGTSTNGNRYLFGPYFGLNHVGLISAWAQTASATNVVWIMSPQHGANYNTPNGLPLVANYLAGQSAISATGQNLAAAPTIRWTSSRQGDLGVGSSLQARLITGVHWITATIGQPGQAGHASQSALVGINGPPGVITATPTSAGCFRIEWTMPPGRWPAFVTSEPNGSVLWANAIENQEQSGSVNRCPGGGITQIALWARYQGYHQLVATTPVVMPPPTGWITASPQTVAIPAGQPNASTTIQFDWFGFPAFACTFVSCWIPQAASAEVWVSVDGAPRTIVHRAGERSVVVNWIQPGKQYNFELYMSPSWAFPETRLAGVVVRGISVPAPPTTPTGLQGPPNEITLTNRHTNVDWTASTGAVTHYDIEIETPGQGIAMGRSTSTAYSVHATAFGTKNVRVRACNGPSCSSFSNTISVRFLGEPPTGGTARFSNYAQAGSPYSVWIHPLGGLDSTGWNWFHRAEAQESRTPDFAAVAALDPSTNANWILVRPQGTYYYRIRTCIWDVCSQWRTARNSSGEGLIVVAPQSFPVGITVNCTARTCDFSAAADTGPLTSYRWNFGDGNAHSTLYSTWTHTYASAGSYTVSVVASGLNGQTGTAEVFVTVQ